MFDLPIYIIRNGEFGSDFESKFFMAIFALVISIIAWKKTQNKDYFWVFIIGSILWSGVEFWVQFIGLREFNPVTLFGVSIPLIIVAILRGAAEGGFVAFFGLFLGDLILNKKTRTKGLITLFIFMGIMVIATILHGLPEKIIGSDIVASRRDIFAPISILFTTLVSLGSIYWLIQIKPVVRARALSLFSVMIATSGIWTIAQVCNNMRWVEIMSAAGLVRASPLIEFGTLFYDVVFEIGLMYIPFFAIPYMLKLFRENEQWS